MRHQPKLFAPPRSRAAREAEWPETVDFVEILKDAWPMNGGLVRPWWAKTARKFGWITAGEYYSIKRTEPDMERPITELLYEAHPMFRMLPRRAS